MCSIDSQYYLQSIFEMSVYYSKVSVHTYAERWDYNSTESVAMFTNKNKYADK